MEGIVWQSEFKAAEAAKRRARYGLLYVEPNAPMIGMNQTLWELRDRVCVWYHNQVTGAIVRVRKENWHTFYRPG